MLLHDLRFAARALRKAPVFAVAAILTLAIGIGANTAIFSVVNAVMLRPLPFREPTQLVRIFEKNEKQNLSQFSSSVLNYLSWKEQSQSFESIGAMGFVNLNLTGRGDPEQFPGVTLTPSIFPMLGIHPIMGREFRDGDDKPGAAPVVILSEGLFKRRFANDPSLVGETIMLNGVATTVVGIAPRSLFYLTGADFSVPLVIDPAKEFRLQHQSYAMARLKPGVSLRRAQLEMDTIATRMSQHYPEMKDWGVELLDFYHWFVADQLRTALLALLGAVALVLLIASANIANLLLSRAAARQKEIAVRTALGASSSRLLGQFLTESILLAMLGGGTGLLGAFWAVRAINAALAPNLLPVPDIPVDARVLTFAIAATLVTGLLFGLAPAWHALNSDLSLLLNSGGRSSTGAPRSSLRNWLVGGELAMATILLIGAGLLMQSLQRLQQVRLGFEPQGLLTFQVALPAAKYQSPASRWAFYRQMLESLRSLPGVESTALSSGIPLGAGLYTTTPANTIGKTLLAPGAAIPIDWRIVSADYFHAMGIQLLRGRYFDEHDGPDGPRVMIVSQDTATKLWGADDPIGRQVHIVGNGKNYEVVGVVASVHNNSLNQSPTPAMYYPATAVQPLQTDVVVRTHGKPGGALPAIRRKIHELDSELPLSNIRDMDEWIYTNAAQPRLNTILLAGFAAVAVLIAIIGIYGVLAYSVNQRTGEIGVRMALGAQQSDVRRLVVNEGMRVSLAGIFAGMAGALALSRVLNSLLFEVKAHDPVTFVAVPIVLAGVALAACYAPARRASRMDPIVALRCQ